MNLREDEFLKTLRATFKVEAGEHLQAIATGLLGIEKTATPEEQQRLIETIFRAAHSLKGAARAVNLREIESICQSLEDLFAGWKRRDSMPTPATLDVAHRALDAISRMLETEASAPVKSSGTAPASQPKLPSAASAPMPSIPVPGEKPPSSAPIQAAPAASVPPHPAPPAPSPAPASTGEETVRVPVHALDARLLGAEEMLAAKLAAGQRAADLGALAGRFAEWHEEWSKVQPQTRALRHAGERPSPATTANLAALAEFFDWNHDYVRALETKVAALRRSADRDRLVVGKLVDDLLEDSKKLLMLPLATLGVLFPKLVRDLCRDQGKEADLTIRGEEVKIDKRILEEMKDPLIHLLRNCIDHGIEMPQERRRLGKPQRATITLAVSPVNGSKVELMVADDGAGIDVSKVKAAAVKQGRLSPEAAGQLTDGETLNLIFETDVSTSPIITQVSGRGLGLAIVREKAEKLGGHVTVESQPGIGTTIRMMLPLTLATFRGVLIEAAQRLFVVPTAQVERVTRFKAQDVQTVEARETLALNGRAISLVRLADVLQLPPARRTTEPSAATPALILGSGEQRIACAVDAVLEEREVLVKQLGRPLVRVRNIAGATILGSGEVAPILNVSDLLKSAKHAGAPVHRTAEAQPAAAPARTILVVEDSITSRMLIKGVLEAAGYTVKTAVDGIEGFTALRAGHFDLVVSDVEMPRLNGFDLTARIRADKALKELPVVLVTALESREDRERGIDVGANAYLVKSSFDQSNLLETLRRLV